MWLPGPIRTYGGHVTFNDDDIHQARRAAVRNGLTDAGMDLELADRWCDAWETEATLQRIIRSAAYWQIGKRWIDERRSVGDQP
jgi:hypothetical protein